MKRKSREHNELPSKKYIKREVWNNKFNLSFNFELDDKMYSKYEIVEMLNVYETRLFSLFNEYRKCCI